jgi:hypothetical protein
VPLREEALGIDGLRARGKIRFPPTGLLALRLNFSVIFQKPTTNGRASPLLSELKNNKTKT